MLARFIYSMNWFSTAKYEILKGKYLIPPPPKRPLSSYLLFSNDMRSSINATNPEAKTSVTETAKQLGQKWKSITPEEKQKYEEKAKELREKYQHEANKYKQLYVNPFKKVNYNTLMMREFYSKNKVGSIAEGAEALKKMRAELKEQDIAKYKALADEQNKSNEKIAKQYQIPVKPYKTFAAYLRHMQKQKNLPKKSQLDQKQLAKLQKDFEESQELYKIQLTSFARSFHIAMPDLIKLMNKQKDSSEKLDQQGNELKELAAKEKEKATEDYKKSKEKLAAQKKKFIEKTKKQGEREIKKLQKQVEKKKKATIRVNAKFTGKLSQIKRKRTELTAAEKAERKLAKEKKAQQTKGLGTATDGTTVPAGTTTQAPKKKAGRKPKAAGTSTPGSTPTQTQPKKEATSKPTGTGTTTTGTQTQAQTQAQTQTQAGK